jgi:GT2 family glycosyltransferase
MQKITVSIIIVYFSGWKDFIKCLQSIKLQKSQYKFETIVINNGHELIKDKLKKILPRAVYIQNEKNGGYGAGNNLGATKATGKYLFILNPDVELQKNAIDYLVQFLEIHKKTAITAPQLLLPDKTKYLLVGSRDLTPLTGIVCHSFLNTLFPNNPISRNYFMYDVSVYQKRKAFAVPGCAFMVRKKIFDEVGKFDENMFLYYEESDLGKRLQDKGYEEYVIPEAKVIHNHSIDNDTELKKFNIKSRYYYFKKHYGVASAIIVELFCRFSKRKAIIAGGILLAVVLGYTWYSFLR